MVALDSMQDGKELGGILQLLTQDQGSIVDLLDGWRRLAVCHQQGNTQGHLKSQLLLSPFGCVGKSRH